MTILSAGLIGLLAGFSLSIRAGNRAMRLEQAVTLAENRLALAVGRTAEQCLPEAGTEGRYHYEVNYQDKPEQLMAATVRVRWLDGGRMRTFSLSRLFLPLRPRGGGD